MQFDDDTLAGKLKDEREELAKGAPLPAPPPQAPPGGQASGGQKPAGEAVAVRAPLLIYTAQIGMAVFQVTESLDRVEAIARELGGFLARRDDRAITIRVPVARFDEAVRRLDAVGDVLQRNVAVEDVTAEYVDMEIRLKNARAVRDRLEKLLEKAATVEESVLLEKELGRVAGEIERIEGRLKFLRDRAAFSTITVTFQPRPRESIDPTGPRLPVDWLNNLGLSRLLNL
jgi:RNAse (barnase) inhibitor barstar